MKLLFIVILHIFYLNCQRVYMNGIYTIIVCLLLLSSCSTRIQKEEKENLVAKSLLQGIWMDEMTETPLFRIKGDTIYYVDESVTPVAFKIIGDSLKTYGLQTSSYHIKKQEEFSFWIQSVVGDVLKLSKIDNELDSILVVQSSPMNQEPAKEVIQKDDVVYYNNVRYRGYVYINPTDIKVIQPGISEEGLEVENVYYDNIIHICVYEGKNRLFGKDVKKQDFITLIPGEYYHRAILSDMDFVGVTEKGYQYQATVCVPNNVSCYLVNISICFNGDINYELAQ